MSEPKQFPANAYDVILCVLQLIAIAMLLVMPLHAWGKSLGAGLFVLLLPHWTNKRSKLWWTLIAVGTAFVLAALILAFHS
jgi:hypothetical protein